MSSLTTDVDVVCSGGFDGSMVHFTVAFHSPSSFFRRSWLGPGMESFIIISCMACSSMAGFAAGAALAFPPAEAVAGAKSGPVATHSRGGESQGGPFLV